MSRSRILMALLVLLHLPAAPSRAGTPEAKTVAQIVEGLERRTGLLTFWIDPRGGRVLLEVPPSLDGLELLYVEGLVSGLGSNPVGLDRGQIGPARLVTLRRIGGRLLVEEANLAFRARSADATERRAVLESFAPSVLWGGKLEAVDDDGTAVVDLTSFLVRDAHGSADTLKAAGQGTFTLDDSRSAIDLDACLAFPDNVEFETLLTFHGSEPGPEVRGTAPSAEWVSLRQHQSFLRLPDDGYRTRRFDPRAGSFEVAFRDYAAPLDAALETRWIVRHRLEKVDPGASRSPVREPIVYYVDRGAPEPVRSALVEGARWWAAAFDAAGFVDAFRVELLPEGAHPLDARYNVIEWVHRATRGWSYGGGVIDPRTGEMIKGHVNLGSLRVRQDRLLFEGLAGTARVGTGAPDDPVQLALARIRQLSAHEVGHTLGLMHNFAASTYGRASVMDYPAPLVTVTSGGDLDFSRAYGVGVGEWDVQAIRYAYTQFPSGADEARELETIVQDGIARGLLFLSDEAARPAGAAQPLANLWDNGEDPVEELTRLLQVRRIALDRFGADAVQPGVPLALLQEVLVPLYLHHRYQLQAAAKVIGGLDYTYVLRGDGQPPARLLDPAWQRRALDAILSTLDPAALDLPDGVLALLMPRPPAYGPTRELFHGATDPAFDPLGAAAVAAALAVDGLLQPERAARLGDFHRRDPAQPGLEPVLHELQARVLSAPPPDPRAAEIARVVRGVIVDGMLRLSADDGATRGVRARVDAGLQDLWAALQQGEASDAADAADRASLAAAIRRHLDRPAPPGRGSSSPPEVPPGDPIGAPRGTGADRR